jgi:peptidoglycan/xylan/chitin deacetylase (PgdA/CDA1 family)
MSTTVAWRARRHPDDDEATPIPILLYHSIAADPAPWIARYAVTPAAFKHHVDLIISSGRNPITVSSLCAALGGQSPMPPRPVVITFDDGFADFADAAAVLGRHHIPSTVYVTTGALRGHGPRTTEMAIPPAPMLHWSQLAELELSNVEIGAHTHTHRQLDIMRTKEVADELRHSKEMLEDELGHQVPSFAYPHGFHCSRIRRVVATTGHTSAAAVMNALSSQRDDPFSLARLMIRANTTPNQISEWLDGRGARIAPYRERVRTKAWRMYRRARGSRSTRAVIDLSANTY